MHYDECIESNNFVNCLICGLSSIETDSTCARVKSVYEDR
jgi:hypothetical protein